MLSSGNCPKTFYRDVRLSLVIVVVDGDPAEDEDLFQSRRKRL